MGTGYAPALRARLICARSTSVVPAQIPSSAIDEVMAYSIHGRRTGQSRQTASAALVVLAVGNHRSVPAPRHDAQRCQPGRRASNDRSGHSAAYASVAYSAYASSSTIEATIAGAAPNGTAPRNRRYQAW